MPLVGPAVRAAQVLGRPGAGPRRPGLLVAGPGGLSSLPPRPQSPGSSYRDPAVRVTVVVAQQARRAAHRRPSPHGPCAPAAAGYGPRVGCPDHAYRGHTLQGPYTYGARFPSRCGSSPAESRETWVRSNAQAASCWQAADANKRRCRLSRMSESLAPTPERHSVAAQERYWKATLPLCRATESHPFGGQDDGSSPFGH
jgi:hypothetical protein